MQQSTNLCHGVRELRFGSGGSAVKWAMSVQTLKSGLPVVVWSWPMVAARAPVAPGNGLAVGGEVEVQMPVPVGAFGGGGFGLRGLSLVGDVVVGSGALGQAAISARSVWARWSMPSRDWGVR